MDHIKAINKAVKAAGSQSKLATLAGCAQQRINDIVKGRRRLSAELAVKISKATGIPRSELRPDLFGDAA
jgi:DNA-binding transcriptional regulator YdaS (Cro superfamily)